ncbi:MAG: YegS/Rv2252/BmrU family lipid kinase [Lachnospiraceae bacterium]|nr:YegS/Rv2252/BmrU family lipid kinase [Lachnospiraceae bacterium]
MFHIIINPETASGHGIQAWKDLKPLVDAQDMDYKLYVSTERNDFGKIISKLTSRLSGSDHADIIIIGGDGSMNQAVNSIKDFRRTRIAFISKGSGNDLSRALCAGKTREEIIKDISDGKIKRSVDIGVMESGDRRILFNISSGLGFDAESCEKANRMKLKKLLNRVRLGRLVYVLTAISMIIKNRTFLCRITYDDSTERVYEKCLFAVVMNTAFEGGGFKFCPEADNTDGMLDLCITDRIHPFRFFTLFPKAYSGKHAGRRGIKIEKARKVRISSDEPVWIHTDGEVSFKVSDASFSIHEEKLNLLM